MVVFIGFMIGCSNKKTLPIYGRKQVTEKEVNGNMVPDTVYHTINEFEFTNQDGHPFGSKELEGHIYVSDFFFTSCPDICIKMSAEMLRLYETFNAVDELTLVSFTIDPTHDSVEVLKEYADKLEVSTPKWHFLTAEKSEIYKLGQTSYMVTAADNPAAPGGFLHSGAFILVDKQKRIRGIYDGTNAEQVDRLIADIPYLLDEYKQ